jgi:hypothetical protein
LRRCRATGSVSFSLRDTTHLIAFVRTEHLDIPYYRVSRSRQQSTALKQWKMIESSRER